MASDCKRLLEEGAEALREFNPMNIEGRLVIRGVAGGLEFVYTAECSDDGKLLVMGGIPAFFLKLPEKCEVALKLLERVMELGSQEYLLVSKLDSSLVMAIPALSPDEVEPQDLVRYFSLLALIVLWLDRQLERAAQGEEPEPFSVEEAARLIGEGEGDEE